MTSSMTGFSPRTTATGMKEKIPSGYRAGAMQQFTPEQMELFQQLFSHVGPESFLSQLAGGDEQAFQQVEGPAMRDFASQMGNMASRFSGMGGLGSRKSSGFQNTMTAAGSNFAQDLASKRMGLQRQALSDLFGMSNMLMGQKPFERFLVEKQQKPSFWQQIAPLAGGAIGAAFGGPMGASLGSQLGSLAGGGQGNFSGIGSLPTSWNFGG